MYFTSEPDQRVTIMTNIHPRNPDETYAKNLFTKIYWEFFNLTVGLCEQIVVPKLTQSMYS